MNFRKIVAIVAAALMLFSILPISAMAADTNRADFDAIAKTNTSYTSFTTTAGWSVTNAAVFQGGTKNSSPTFSMIGSSSATKAVCINGKKSAAGTITSPDLTGGISQLTLNYGLPFSKDKISFTITITGTSGKSATKTVENSSATQYTGYSLDWTLDEQITGNFTIKIVNNSPSNSTSNKDRTAIWNLEWVSATGSSCDHSGLTCGATCPECNEYIKEHKYPYACSEICADCSEPNSNAVAHTYYGAYDADCNVCGGANPDALPLPAADSELTIAEAIAIGESMAHDTTTSDKYYVTGVVESIANTNYGNLYLLDTEGNKLYVYGTYDADGTNGYANMTEKPEVDMTITVYGVIGNYNGAQMKNGWITEMIGGCEHEYEYECSTTCSICGEGEREASCKTDAEYACQDGNCDYCGDPVAALEHAYDDQWDPDCNYGCGTTREVEPRPAYSTITFDADKTQRTEFDTEHQVWVADALTLTNNKGESTTNVGDYSGRFYKSSDVIIAFPGMTSLVIDATGIGSSYLWEYTLDAAGVTYTVEEQVYTITFAEPVNSVTFVAANQVRAVSITAYGAAQEPECQHEYVNPCDKVCMLCGELTRPEADHTYDDACDADCNVCGGFREAPHVYTDGCDDMCDLCDAWRPAPHNLTIYHEADLPENCQDEGHDEYWECADCGALFADEEAMMGINPAWLNYTGECTRPEDAAHCANVACEVCGEMTYGDGAHTPLYCQGGVCEDCGDTIEGWGCANYTTPACMDGVCDYCGGFVAGYGHENGAWANCIEGECGYGCGLTYPATAHHVDADANGFCDNCWNTYVAAENEHVYDDEYDATCNVCGEVREDDLDIITFGGASMRDSSDGISGLAFLFKVNAPGLAVNGTTAVYEEATINNYKLVTMGANVSNGKSEAKVEAVYLCEWDVSGEAAYAIRIIDIPDNCYNVAITATPYVVLEIDGAQVTIEDDAAVRCVNDVQG